MPVKTYFVTNRIPTGDSDFTGEASPIGELRFGEAIVPDSLFGPIRHKGSLSKIDVNIYPDKSGTPNRFGSEICFENIKQDCQDRNGKEILLYVHGYNTTFRQSLYSIADIGRRLIRQRQNFPEKRPGWQCPSSDPVFMVFSWPSDGALLRYRQDQDDARDSATATSRLFGLLNDALIGHGVYSQFNISGLRLHMLCQSMGNLVLMHGLQALISKSERLRWIFNHIFLGAADVPRDAFNDNDKLIPLKYIARQITLYYNPLDTVISMGGTPINWRSRLGLMGPSPNADMESVAAVNCQEPAERAKNPQDDLSRHYYTRLSSEVQDDILQVLSDVTPDAIKGRVNVGPSRYKIP